jgi:endonuclease/exonuclease/phosphatase family metal-dependent hydrolase
MAIGSRRRMLLALAALAAGVLAVSPPAQASGDAEIKVMTRNLYFGTDLGPVIAAGPPPAFFGAVAAAYSQALESDFQGRAAVWAEEIAEAEPDLIGLQEAVLWRTGAADFSATPNAATVTMDPLGLLLAELDARGLHYRVAAIQDGYDVEAPGLFATGLLDVRVTQREVILAREGTGLKLSNPQGDVYEARVTLTPFPGASFGLPWAWASIDVVRQGHDFRFATTHLDSISGVAQLAQANEFLAGPGGGALPIVWLGDFNSNANGEPVTGTPPATATYGAITAAGFTDAWKRKHPMNPGLTCCQATDLRNEESSLSQRIDLVFTRGPFEVEEAEVIGEEAGDRLPSGLWPSDHAGVVVTLKLEGD